MPKLKAESLHSGRFSSGFSTVDATAPASSILYTSLVNQPYFSCAHISQSAHARDEGAGKIRLARVLCALAEICQSQSDCSKRCYWRQYSNSCGRSLLKHGTHKYARLHTETLIANHLRTNVLCRTASKFTDIRNGERAPSALEGLVGVLAYGYTPWCGVVAIVVQTTALSYVCIRIYVLHVSTCLRSIYFGRNIPFRFLDPGRRIFPAPSSRACALWEICAQEKYGWFTRLHARHNCTDPARFLKRLTSRLLLHWDTRGNNDVTAS